MQFAEFKEAVKDLTPDALRQAVESELGVKLTSTKKRDLLKEAFEAYCKAQGLDPEAPAPAAPAPAAPAPEAPAPEAPAPEAPAPEAPAPEAPGDPGPLPCEVRYLGRSKTGRAFRKAGRTFVPQWGPIGTLTEAEQTELARFSAFIQIKPLE